MSNHGASRKFSSYLVSKMKRVKSFTWRTSLLFLYCYDTWNVPNIITGIVCFIVLYFIDLSKSFLLQIEGDFCLCFFFNFYWSTVDLQYCITFCYTAQWISCTCTYIYTFLDSFPIYVNTSIYIHIHHRELSRVPCVIAVVLTSYLVHI